MSQSPFHSFPRILRTSRFRRFSWRNHDYQNRLVQVNQGTGVLAQYQYDILGRRIQKTTPTEATLYIYAGDNIIQELKTTGGLVLKKEYINGLGTDNLIAYDAQESANQDKISFCQIRVLPYSSEFTTYGYSSLIADCNATMSSSTGVTTKRYFYHVNHLGSVIALSNGSGEVMQNYTYDSFGKAYVVSGSGTLTSVDSVSNLYSNTRLYTGREYDKETGLYFNRARYYNPETGRFTSRDPIGQRDQINLYTYVANNPLNYVDRLGKSSKAVLIITGMETLDQPSAVSHGVAVEKKNLSQLGITDNMIQVKPISSFNDLKNVFNEINQRDIHYSNVQILHVV